MLDPEVRLGTSTPKADPSGDYAWQLFEQADALRPGSFATLDAKALQADRRAGFGQGARRPQHLWLGDGAGPGGPVPHLLHQRRAGAAEVPELQIVSLPEELAVGADYGLIVRKDAPDAAWRLALFILAPEGQSILADYGFTSGALPQKE